MHAHVDILISDTVWSDLCTWAHGAVWFFGDAALKATAYINGPWQINCVCVCVCDSAVIKLSVTINQSFCFASNQSIL